MTGILPITDELASTLAAETFGWVLYLSADQDYLIISASAAPDANAVAAGTFGVFVGKVNAGSSTAGLRARTTFTSAVPTPAQVGSLSEGWLYNPQDPTGLGLYCVPLLAANPVNVLFYHPSDRPVLKRGEVLAIVVTNTAKANIGVVVVQVIGRPLTPAESAVLTGS